MNVPSMTASPNASSGSMTRRRSRRLANPHGDAGRGSVAEVKRAVAGIVHGEIASAHDPRQHQLQGKKHDEGGTSLIAPLKPTPFSSRPIIRKRRSGNCSEAPRSCHLPLSAAWRRAGGAGVEEPQLARRESDTA